MRYTGDFSRVFSPVAIACRHLSFLSFPHKCTREMKRTRPTLNLLNDEGKQKYLSGPPLLPLELYQKLGKKSLPTEHFDVLLVSVGDDDEKKQCVLRCKLCHEDLSPANPSGSKNAHVGKEVCNRRAKQQPSSQLAALAAPHLSRSRPPSQTTSSKARSSLSSRTSWPSGFTQSQEGQCSGVAGSGGQRHTAPQLLGQQGLGDVPLDGATR